jgi:hypothetical protein
MNRNSSIFAIIAAIVIIVAAFFIYKNVTGGGGSEATAVVKPKSPKDTNPNWSPDTNRPPELGKAGGG